MGEKIKNVENEEKNKEMKIRGFQPMSPPGYPGVSAKNFSPFGPAVWPAIVNIYTSVLF